MTALLRQFKVQAAPVPVDRIAEGLGARITFQPFDDNLSGILVRLDDGTAAIAVNSSHAPARQRFTIAHEIGHLLLHEGRPVFVDRLVRVNLRHQPSAKPSREETVANRFAAELLMPESILMGSIINLRDSHVSGHDMIALLADRFQTSAQAMEYRLADFGLSLPS
ncbi:MAG: ImmA/IrrE family metallo-endopeptidase [Candidatus Dormibacteria bacterium]